MVYMVSSTFQSWFNNAVKGPMPFAWNEHRKLFSNNNYLQVPIPPVWDY